MTKQLSNSNDGKWPKGQKQSKKPAREKTVRNRTDKEWQLPDRLRTISLKSIAELLDTTRSSVRRWLKEAGIRPLAMGRGAKGAIRYKWKDIERWLESHEYVE
ncbi:MAG: helix-turn-helix domain-containing protein [Planctomycetota bacterium]|jgi:DNA invertase Pin-like site-specific DNA recombinase